jgi:hypothetical protein
LKIVFAESLHQGSRQRDNFFLKIVFAESILEGSRQSWVFGIPLAPLPRVLSAKLPFSPRELSAKAPFYRFAESLSANRPKFFFYFFIQFPLI